jgi:hypothetical protein
MYVQIEFYQINNSQSASLCHVRAELFKEIGLKDRSEAYKTKITKPNLQAHDELSSCMLKFLDGQDSNAMSSSITGGFIEKQSLKDRPVLIGQRSSAKRQSLYIRTPESNLTTAAELQDFYCTFCWKCFANRASWQQHERGQHLWFIMLDI